METAGWSEAQHIAEFFERDRFAQENGIRVAEVRLGFARTEMTVEARQAHAGARHVEPLGHDGERGDGVEGQATAVVSAARPPSDYTARVIPHYDGVAVPLEAGHILWQR